LFPEENGQAADVVEMAVRNDDQVEGHTPQRSEIGGCGAADLLRVEAAIKEDLQVAELEVKGIRADATVAVEVD
jgi:hypothetical protein